MRSAIIALTLLATIGAVSIGVASRTIAEPVKARRVSAKLPPAGLGTAPSTTATVANSIPGGPAASPITPRGWLVTSPRGGAIVPRIVEWGPAGYRDSIEGGMLGCTHYGDNGFHSPSANPGKTWLKVYVNGASEVHMPGGWAGFGMGPSSPGGNFTLSNGFTVTAIP